jgi:hypothetical protein
MPGPNWSSLAASHGTLGFNGGLDIGIADTEKSDQSEEESYDTSSLKGYPKASFLFVTEDKFQPFWRICCPGYLEVRSSCRLIGVSFLLYLCTKMLDAP